MKDPETERLLDILRRADEEADRLYQYTPNRALGWVSVVMSGLISKLRQDLGEHSADPCGIPLDGGGSAAKRA